LETAVRLNPGHAEAQLDLGNVLLSLGRPAGAAARYEAALRLRPDFSQARNNLDLAKRQMSAGSGGSLH
jgi:protein O-mannosyl-transferase